MPTIKQHNSIGSLVYIGTRYMLEGLGLVFVLMGVGVPEF